MIRQREKIPVPYSKIKKPPHLEGNFYDFYARYKDCFRDDISLTLARDYFEEGF